jgi:hypothetical protein
MRYTIRPGIERDQWSVAIYPADRDHATLTESKILAISPVFSYLDQCLILRA